MYNTKKYVSLLTAIGLLASLFATTPVFAETNPSTNTSATPHTAWGGGMHMPPGIFGTVASIDGSTLTVTSKMWEKGTSGSNTTTSVTYTVDASNATVTKNGTTSTLSDVAVGDMVMVAGTVNGTNVAATAIRDGMPKMGMGMRGGKGGTPPTPPTPVIQGNGEPIVGGTVAVINGSTLTVTNKSNVTYTVDATNAVIEKGNKASTLAGVTVGDSVVVQGTVNGTSITASSIMDQGIPPTASSTASGSAKGHSGFMGFFGSIGSFFGHIFGF